MNSTSIKKIKETKILPLSKWKLFWHYFLGLIPLSLGIMDLFWLIEMRNSENYNGIRTKNEIITSTIVWFSLALLVLIIKKRRLNFERINIKLSETEFKQNMLKIAENEKWNLTKNTKKFAVFYHGSWWTWGLKMTILKFENYLLVNSICDTDERPCFSIFNENERNIKKLKKNLKKPVANTV
jgi:hypothetical protein